MKISFHGAAREVTGSCHLVETDKARILLDCGMIQGGKERHERNREPFPFDAKSLDLVVLSHAHIDHSGRLPLLRKAGYRGPILATPSTCHLAEILLADSGHIHEEDARWKIKRLKKRREDYSWVTPLFTQGDAFAVMGQFEPLRFDTPYEMSNGAATVRLIKAGHILGAAIVELTLRENDTERKLVFSGDLGVDGARLLSQPHLPEAPDYLLMESTYGDRSRQENNERTEELYEVIRRTTQRGGKVIIPSFAVGRTQEVLARINDLVESRRLSRIPVYVDSPMAITATHIFARHADAYSEEAREKLRAGDEPLDFPGLKLTKRVQDSMEINRRREPAVIISASGMCTAGRIKHHLKHNISDPRNTILFVGYQAHGSLGRLILEGTNPVRIFGDWFPVRAEIDRIEGFSAHADREELQRWFGGLGKKPRKTWLVHGEEDAALSLAKALEDGYGADVDVPRMNQTINLD